MASLTFTLSLQLEHYEPKIALAIALSNIVLPALGGETINPRCPRPIGAIRFTSRVDRSSGEVSRSIILSGKVGVNELK